MLGIWRAYSEMFCHLRPLRRFCQKTLPHWVLHSRALSGAEAVNALRPFYFAVHPDFFGQYPREREVNENSLKRLNVYLENLQKPGFKSLKPTQLTFYIREKTTQSCSEGQEPVSTAGEYLPSRYVWVPHACLVPEVRRARQTPALELQIVVSYYVGLRIEPNFSTRALQLSPQPCLLKAESHCMSLAGLELDVDQIASDRESPSFCLLNAGLSVEHVQGLNTRVHSQPLRGAAASPDRPIKWHKSYYCYTGFRDPDEDLEHVSRVETTLTSWLGSNERSAVRKLKSSLPLRKELDRLKNELSDLLQLSDIRWQRGWGVAHRCSQLHSLSRLAHQNLEPLQNAKGCTIVFTDRSGVSALGHVMLGTMDVHHHWTRLFESLPSYFDLQRRMSALEDQISNLLGGIQVVYIEELQPAFTLEEYCSLLDVFCNRLLRSRPPLHPHSLRGLQMILSSDTCAPSLHELGHFNIPALSDPASFQAFMRTKAQQARENTTRRETLKVIENELIEASTKKFSLEKLYKEPSISSRQMVDCCKRLLEQSLPYLRGMHLCVSHFYSVMQDGDLCIPWNWKEEVMK